jgi:hypothetical protein
MVRCLPDVHVVARILLVILGPPKKFNQTYMLARELGSGAFSIVKLGVHLVRYHFATSALQLRR